MPGERRPEDVKPVSADADEVGGTFLTDQGLSIAQAAERLGSSIPYVAMLCERGKLGEIVMTPDGHRRISAAGLDAYSASLPKVTAGDLSYQEVALRAGMYDIPEERYAGFVREPVDERSLSEDDSLRVPMPKQ